MGNESVILFLSALSIGFFHTILGPDHYIPFIVISKARNWSVWKTGIITFFCGLGHVGSSLLIGILGIFLGLSLDKVVSIETSRGAIAAWMMITFGFLYLIWGVRKSMKSKKHDHLHYHNNGTAHIHKHEHFSEHSHPHNIKNSKELTPWILFIIFIFGPCEPFIPLLLYPAVKNNLSEMIMVTFTFTGITIITMIAIVSASILGLKFIPTLKLERHIHTFAGGTILLCGLCIKFFGL